MAAGVAAQVTRPRIIVSEGEASRSEVCWFSIVLILLRNHISSFTISTCEFNSFQLSIYDNDAEEAEYELIEDTPLLAPYVGCLLA